MELTKEEIQTAITIAKDSKDNAFVINFNKKGACLISADGEFFGGCNVEMNVSGLGVCSERSAVDHAIVHGKYDYKALVVFDEDDYTVPCGVCLQYLNLFYHLNRHEITIISAKSEEDYTETKYTKLFNASEYTSNNSIKKIQGYRKY